MVNLFGMVSFQCGEFFQIVEDLLDVLNKIEIHPSGVIQNMYCMTINQCAVTVELTGVYLE